MAANSVSAFCQLLLHFSRQLMQLSSAASTPLPQPPGASPVLFRLSK
jgi:hypothetical protein